MAAHRRLRLPAGLAPLHPQNTALEGGRVRRLSNPGGEVIIERLVEFNEQERCYSYAILEAPFPVTGCISMLRVHAVPGEAEVAEVQWSGRFVPQGVTDAEAVDLFTGIYRGGLDALHNALG